MYSEKVFIVVGIAYCHMNRQGMVCQQYCSIAVSVQRSRGIRPENPAIEAPADFDGDIGSSQDVACSNEPCPGLDLLTGVVCPKPQIASRSDVSACSGVRSTLRSLSIVRSVCCKLGRHGTVCKGGVATVAQTPCAGCVYRLLLCCQ